MVHKRLGKPNHSSAQSGGHHGTTHDVPVVELSIVNNLLAVFRKLEVDLPTNVLFWETSSDPSKFPEVAVDAQ